MIIIFGDTDEKYCERFTDYMNNRKALVFTVRGYTDPAVLEKSALKNDVHLVLVSESMRKCINSDLFSNKLVILSGQKEQTEGSVRTIYRYQPASVILRQIMSVLEQAEEEIPVERGKVKTGLIGMYSPVKRCLQTSFSVVMGQLLSKNHSVLYVNFEAYSGFWGHNGVWEHSAAKNISALDEGRMDLADLMYYLKNVQDRFVFRLGSSVIRVGGMDFIPPAMSFADISSVTPEEWMAFFQKIREESEYEYIILDLSDHLQGLFDILRECEKVYTIVRNEGICLAKTEQYKEMLRIGGYEDVLKKTRENKIPLYREIPSKWEQLPYSELAGYVRQIVEEDFEEL